MDRDVHRDLVPLHEFHLEEDQLRLCFPEIQAIPIDGFRALCNRLTRSSREWNVGRVITRGEDRLSQLDLHRGLPIVDRRALYLRRTRPAVHLELISALQRGGGHHDLCCPRLGHAKLRVKIGIAGVQRFACEYSRALTNFYVHSRIRSYSRERTERIKDAVLSVRPQISKRDRLTLHRTRSRRHDG